MSPATGMRGRGERTGGAAAVAAAAVAALALALVLSHAARADLVGREEVRSAVAGRSDEALIAANPALEQLGRARPDLLREALARLRSGAPSHRRSLEDAAAEPASAEESSALSENPDLDELYRESPEAALDLLRLIREAAKKK